MSEEEKQQQPEATPQTKATHFAPSETNKPKENKKEKCRPIAKV